MRDLVLSLLIGTTVIFGATETVGITHFLEGQDPSSAVRRAVHDMGVPALPTLPEISIPDPRGLLPTSGAAPSPTAQATAAGQAVSNVKTMFIAHTNGAGVRARPSCADAVLGPTGVAEGAAVEFIRAGGGECPGWGLVRSGDLEFWVRMAYLDGSAPKAIAPPSKGASVPAPAPPPDASNAAPKPEPAQPEPANRHGKPEDKGEKPQEPGKPEPVATIAAAPTVTPTVTATSAPTPAASPPPTATPLPNLPVEDEQ